MTQAQQPEALRLAEQCDNFANRTAIATCLRAQHHRILELEGSVTHLENVYGAAIRKVVELEQGKCLHQIAEPAAALTEQDSALLNQAIELLLAISNDERNSGNCSAAEGATASAYAVQRLAAALLTTQHAAPLAAVHPDDSAVDALAVLMKAKLAEKRAMGYGGWNDKTQCPQQRLSDMLRAHVDKGDPVDVANFCAMLSSRGEGIAAAPQVAVPVERGEVLVTVSGFTGSGKSAIAGEIEIMCRALGLQVEWPNGVAEKNMTHADWTSALEMYNPRVRIMERNVSLAVAVATTQPAAQEMGAQQFRLVERGELIEAGDQFLRDDFTWQIDPRGIFVGVPHGAALRPARRALATQAKQGGA